jgi:hypothetical protein
VKVVSINSLKSRVFRRASRVSYKGVLHANSALTATVKSGQKALRAMDQKMASLEAERQAVQATSQGLEAKVSACEPSSRVRDASILDHGHILYHW